MGLGLRLGKGVTSCLCRPTSEPSMRIHPSSTCARRRVDSGAIPSQGLEGPKQRKAVGSDLLKLVVVGVDTKPEGGDARALPY